MDKLPTSLLLLILKNLKLTDLIKLRLVNHFFKDLIDKKGIEELTFGNVENESKWYYTNELIDQKYSIKKLNNFTDLFKKAITDFLFLKNLKRLKIIDDDYHFFCYLSKFANLEHFEHECRFNGDYDEIAIVHPNLRILRIFNKDVYSYFDEYDIHFGEEVPYYEINCLNLKILEIYYFFRLVMVINPIGLKHLNCINFKKCKDEDCYSIFSNSDHDYNFGEDLNKFKNLEYLKINDISGLGENVLNRFKKLKRLDISCIGLNSLKKYTVNLLLFKIFSQKILLERDEFEIYLNDEKLNDINDIKLIVNKCFDKLT